MEEAIIIPVCVPKSDDKHELEIRYEGNVVVFLLDFVEVFSGDFNGNFEKAFRRAIELWGAEVRS